MKKVKYKKVTNSPGEIEKYKKIIDEDFKLAPKEFHKRLVQLEKGWIKSLSHNIMHYKNYFMHEDREPFRKELLKYLNQKRQRSLKHIQGRRTTYKRKVRK